MKDCRAITLLSRFARIYGTADLSVIEKTKDEICSAPMSNKSLRWPNKERLKSAGGTWSYPNGTQARSAGGTWTVPEQGTGKVSRRKLVLSGWKRRAVRGGTWTLPHRDTASLDDLRSWARQRVSAADFKRLTAEIEAANGDEEVIAVIELAWLAR